MTKKSMTKKRKSRTKQSRSDLPRVLFVDDEKAIVEQVTDYLRRKGYDVVSAGNAMEALKLHRSRPADIVITDLLLPGMDGNELIRRLRQTDPELPIVVVTGHTTFGDEKETVTEGTSILLKKPFSLRELSDTLIKVVHCNVVAPCGSGS